MVRFKWYSTCSIPNSKERERKGGRGEEGRMDFIKTSCPVVQHLPSKPKALSSTPSPPWHGGAHLQS
jgi:hypothetical protein